MTATRVPARNAFKTSNLLKLGSTKMDNGVCKSTMSAVKAVHGGLFNVLGDDEGTKQNKESNAGWMKGEGREKQSTRNGPVFVAPEPR